MRKKKADRKGQRRENVKDCIIIDNKVKDWGSIEHLRYIYNMAVMADPNFKPEKYKWTLGVGICNALSLMHDMYMIGEETTKRSLFGIEIEPDMYNPKTVKLWKDVTEGQ